MDYQPGAIDQFYHRYDYDAENRLTDVYTSNNKAYVGHKNLEEHEAFYEYYKHGPLARSVIGQQQVQGIDYAYTLEGWLKGVNSTSLNPNYDMGGDGNLVARDAYSFGLNYFTGDYSPINSSVSPFPGFSGLFPPGYSYNPLYNGNISAMSVNIGKLGNPLLYNYQYDQLNRIVAMDAFTGLDSSNNTWNANGLTATDNYKERVAYDGNGNILTYERNGDAARSNPSGTGMDNLTYSYKPNKNQLDKVVDAAPDVAAGEYDKYNDIKQGQQNGNYQYDSIGNLISDAAGGISNIIWTVYGKISGITKTDGSKIAYTYDAAGNRISKTVTPASGAGDSTWYVRDASGNTMAVYTANSSDSLHQTEQDLYGSSRLGLFNRNINADAVLPTGTVANLIGNYFTSNFTRGNKLFELSNHLGNVLVTISDKKFGVDTNGDGIVDYYSPDVASAQDFYPFGMLEPGRNYSVANTNYRYGFNGKENDNDIENGMQDYGMRIYDGRLGRFLSVDPLENEYPELSTFAFASNSPISNIDRDGGESEDASNALEDMREENEKERYENLQPSEDREPPPPPAPEGRVVTKPGLSGTIRAYFIENFNSEGALDNLRDILGAPKTDIYNLQSEPVITPGDKANEELSKSSNSTDRENAARMKRLPKLTVPKKEEVKRTRNTETDTKVKHKNSNNAEGNYSLYDVHAEGENKGEHLKIGKGNADDIMTTTGQMRRARASERAAQKQGYPKATATIRKQLGRTTSGEATDEEAREVKKERAKGNALPLNKERGKKYKN